MIAKVFLNNKRLYYKGQAVYYNTLKKNYSYKSASFKKSIDFTKDNINDLYDEVAKVLTEDALNFPEMQDLYPSLSRLTVRNSIDTCHAVADDSINSYFLSTPTREMFYQLLAVEVSSDTVINGLPVLGTYNKYITKFLMDEIDRFAVLINTLAPDFNKSIMFGFKSVYRIFNSLDNNRLREINFHPIWTSSSSLINPIQRLYSSPNHQYLKDSEGIETSLTLFDHPLFLALNLGGLKQTIDSAHACVFNVMVRNLTLYLATQEDFIELLTSKDYSELPKINMTISGLIRLFGVVVMRNFGLTDLGDFEPNIHMPLTDDLQVRLYKGANDKDIIPSFKDIEDKTLVRVFPQPIYFFVSNSVRSQTKQMSFEDFGEQAELLKTSLL